MLHFFTNNRNKFPVMQELSVVWPIQAWSKWNASLMIIFVLTGLYLLSRLVIPALILAVEQSSNIRRTSNNTWTLMQASIHTIVPTVTRGHNQMKWLKSISRTTTLVFLVSTVSDVNKDLKKCIIWKSTSCIVNSKQFIEGFWLTDYGHCLIYQQHCVLLNECWHFSLCFSI